MHLYSYSSLTFRQKGEAPISVLTVTIIEYAGKNFKTLSTPAVRSHAVRDEADRCCEDRCFTDRYQIKEEANGPSRTKITEEVAILLLIAIMSTSTLVSWYPIQDLLSITSSHTGPPTQCSLSFNTLLVMVHTGTSD